MTKMKTAALAMIAMASGAQAQSFQGTGQPNSHPALAGATVIDFNLPNQTGSALQFGPLTINGTARIQSTYASQYNSFGSYLDNNAGSSNTLVLTFANPISAIGFNLGAADSTWTMSAGSQSATFAPTYGGNDKNFYGLTGLGGVTQVTLQFQNDWVLIDNISFIGGAVPEPATWAMMIVGVGATGGALRRRRQRALTA